MNFQTILDAPKRVLDAPKRVLDAPKRVLQEYYPKYRVESPLPPDLLEICIGFLIEEKKKYHPNGQLEFQGTYVNGKQWFE